MRSGESRKKSSKQADPRREDLRFTIGEMAAAFKISLRTLRFYEDRGLVVPRRTGTTRWYSLGDKARVDLILQGKTLGFSLAEIRDLLAGADKRPDAVRPDLRLTPEQILAQLAFLERQRSDIEGAILKLRTVQSMLGAQADAEMRHPADAYAPQGR